MRLGGGTRLFLALCVWRLVPGQDAAGTEEVVYGEAGGSILLLCRNVSKEATEVVWFQGDPHSVPPLFSSKVTFPQDVRFSLVDNSSLHITELRLQDEGNYTCKEVLNKTDHEHRVQLLVANPPRSSLKCWAGTSSSGQMLQLFCSWPGGNPHPTLHWREEGGNLENTSWVISSTSSADTHVETLNSSRLSHRKTFKCVGSHVVKQEEPACTVEIKRPSLESEPLQTCFVGDNVTLTCRVTESTPAARLSWLQGTTQAAVEIQPGGRYLITQEGNVSRLTIRNCSQDVDGGCYICKAQNPVGLREVFVCLTVKRPVNIVGVVGAVVVLSLLALLVISGIILYYHPLLCLRGTAFRNPDSSDILVLVDSEDDDEGIEEDDITDSSTKHEAMVLVNGMSIQPAYLNHLAEAPGPGEFPPDMALDLEEYLRTAFRDKLRLQKVPAWDTAALQPSTRLLLKQREVAEVERALQAQRQAFGQHTERLTQRRQELVRKEQQLCEEVGQFDAFLEASAARRERALRQARGEREQAARRCDEAACLHRELAGLLRRRQRLARRLRSHRVFGDFLQRVLACTAQFQDVPAMLAHARALAGAREDLARRADAAHEQLAKVQERLRRCRQEAAAEVLRRSNALAGLRARLDAARHDTHLQESHWIHIQTTAAQKTLLLGQIRMAVLNLFQLATKQLKVPATAALEDTEAQLDTVLLCMQDLAAIRAELCPRTIVTASKRLPPPPAPLSQE